MPRAFRSRGILLANRSVRIIVIMLWKLGILLGRPTPFLSNDALQSPLTLISTLYLAHFNHGSCSIHPAFQHHHYHYYHYHYHY